MATTLRAEITERKTAFRVIAKTIKRVISIALKTKRMVNRFSGRRRKLPELKDLYDLGALIAEILGAIQDVSTARADATELFKL